ncbi:hypothetical protein L7F22_027559 [Adiantum nelumboides]|nr:hypothetical protein [Adiantum nelumboides]
MLTSQGGLGIVDPEIQSRALLTKLIVRGLFPGNEPWKMLLQSDLDTVTPTYGVRDGHICTPGMRIMFTNVVVRQDRVSPFVRSLLQIWNSMRKSGLTYWGETAAAWREDPYRLGCLAWHPFHEELFVSGSYDGAILHWLVGHEVPQAEFLNAHENSVWDLAWHPMGHILCSGGNDHTTKFWCRNRPGDPIREKSGIYQQGNMNEQLIPAIGNPPAAFQSAEGPITPGAFGSGGPVRGDGAIPGVGMAMPLLQSSMESGVTVDSSRQQNTFGAMPHGLHPRVPHPPSAPYPSVLASSQSILQQVQVQPLHQVPQQQPLLPIQQSQRLQQVQILPPPPPLPPPRPLVPPMPQQAPPLPPGAAPTTVPTEPLLSRPGLSHSSAPLIVSGQMPSMISIQGLASQLQPQLGSAPAIGVPSMQPLPIPQFQGSGAGGEFVASGVVQTGGLPLSGGQAYMTTVGVQGHSSNLISLGGASYPNLQPPPLPNTAPPTPDAFSVILTC